ncbi:MAG TPA: hypothetical protein PKJ19_09575 [Flavobacteriales bacterium]|nr:hypothetical protein [Flavobacteriales bacterium]HNU57198.1 hypothetical protein [Flavobacteriales bacterium]
MQDLHRLSSGGESGHWIARSEFDSPEVDNEVLIPFNDAVHLRVGDFAEVRITEAREHELMVEVVVNAQGGRL